MTLNPFARRWITVGAVLMLLGAIISSLTV